MNEPATFGGEIGPAEGDFATHNPCVSLFRAGGGHSRKIAAGQGGAALARIEDQFGIT
jgi:hypothetical protein